MSTEVTPIRQQYLDIKKKYPHAILFFRLGDFYETFDADAELVARELDIVLTGRNVAKGARVPMAGIPHHAVESYLSRLITKGYHVAICEQMGDEPVKGLFSREVTRVITPGTVIEPSLLTDNRNNYLASIIIDSHRAALAFVDITTGQFEVAQFDSGDAATALARELTRLSPAEILAPDNQQSAISNQQFTILPQYKFELGSCRQLLLDHFSVTTLAGFGIEQQSLAIRCAGAILHYLKETRPNALNLLVGLSTYSTSEFMSLDSATRRNLELTETIRGGQIKGSLLGILDKTVTPMGARLLRSWVSQPLLNLNEINTRLDAVAALHGDGVLRAEIRSALKPLGDLERLVNRVLGHTAVPRDLGGIRYALAALPKLKGLIGDKGDKRDPLISLISLIDLCPDILKLIQESLADDDLPSNFDHSGIIRAGWSAELDGVMSASKGAREWIAGLEKVERERTGLKTLKVGYNKVFGYYIEISKAAAEGAPENYIRKQTLVNAERFITPELKEYETLVLNAEERILEIEERLFKEICAQIIAQSNRLLTTARALARLDALASLAETAAREKYVRAEIVEDQRLMIKDGRHPVVEKFLESGQRFVPNDVIFEEDESVRIITGPNMSGKCVRGDTLVFTNAGLVPISTLQPAGAKEDSFVPVDYQVKGVEGFAEATHFYTGGRQKTVRLRTRLGYEMEGTREHRVWVRDESGEENWKPLSEIQCGDYVAIDRKIDLWGKQDAIKTPRALSLLPHAAMKFYSLPKKLTPDLAYIMGLLIGDGTLRERNQMALTSADSFIAREFCRIVGEQFGYRARRLRKSKHFDYRISSRQIRLFLEELGFDYVTAIGKRIPQTILSASKAVVRGFLQGLFDTDGYADVKGNVSLSTSSKVLAQQVHILLLNFGIISSLQLKKGVRSVNPNYQVSIYGAEVLTFYREVGFRLPRKQAGLKRVSSLRMPNVGGIPYLALALKQVQSRIVATPNKPVALKHDKSINSIFYTYIPNERNISYAKLDELIDYCESNSVDYPELEILAQRRYFYELVTDISHDESEVFDLAVEGSHSFVANGFVNHNSTFLREAALIVLMAQIGSFVPAESATIGIVDRIFTRIGAQDEIHAGQSTFMVEMVETANILHHATNRSLLVLDEIGRGTSTYDGLSLAWAIVEYIHNHPRLRAKTLFATHYHELTELAKLLPNVRNYNVAVTEDDAAGTVVFLHRIVPGGADRSYGIHVAQMAGLPKTVINRAQEILATLESSSGDVVKTEPSTANQIALFPETNPLLDELKGLDVSSMTPLEALNKLFEWQKRFGDRK